MTARAALTPACAVPSTNGSSALVVRALALEAGQLELHDALAVCLVLLEGEPERYGV